MKSRYCTYIRVSTKKQNASGLGEEAQRAICAICTGNQGGEFVKEFSDVESGKSTTRKGLWNTIDFCKDNCCTLVLQLEGERAVTLHDAPYDVLRVLH